MTKVVKRLEEYEVDGNNSYTIDEGSVFNDEAGFHVWCGGGSIGYVDTIEEARKLILDYAKQRLKEEIKKAKRLMKTREASLIDLGDDVFNLGFFREHMLPHYTYKDKKHYSEKDKMLL